MKVLSVFLYFYLFFFYCPSYLSKKRMWELRVNVKINVEFDWNRFLSFTVKNMLCEKWNLLGLWNHFHVKSPGWKLLQRIFFVRGQPLEVYCLWNQTVYCTCSIHWLFIGKMKYRAIKFLLDCGSASQLEFIPFQ